VLQIIIANTPCWLSLYKVFRETKEKKLVVLLSEERKKAI
jgi:hypothetical protein